MGAPRVDGSVNFVPAFIMCLAQEGCTVDPGTPPAIDTVQDAYDFLTVETYLEGNYMKLNSNDGYVNYDVPFDLINEAAAFSHYTFEQSRGEQIVVDIQGVGRKWTDPQVHSKEKRFGPADLGVDGMKKFFRSHVCSKICKLLKLQSVNPDTLATLTTQDKINEPVPKECVVCLNTPRSMVCRPCGHFCLCVGCADALQSKSSLICPLCQITCAETVHILPVNATFLPPSAIDRAVSRGNPHKKQRLSYT